MESIATRLCAARLFAVRKMPYFAGLLYRMVPREEKGLGTIGVTKGAVLLYDPKVVSEWPVPQLGWVLLHEANHLLREHAERRGTRVTALWNLACDAEINDDLLSAGADFPTVPVTPASFARPDGLIAEDYYAAIQDKGDIVLGVCAGECGSCAGGSTLEGEDEADKAEGRIGFDLATVRYEVAAAIQSHILNHAQGRVPLGLARWADARLSPPRVDWRTKLRNTVRRAVQWKAGAVDLTYRYLSRRQAGIGYGPGRPLLPALRAPVPRVTVAIDTSGSMEEEALKAALSELKGILRAAGSEVDFFACDAEIHGGRQRLRSARRARLAGGGGTDFRPVFEKISSRRERPDVLVFLTDGYGDFPEGPPGYRVIWAILGDCERIPWGEVVRIEA